jgi:hypothetical protein
MQVSKLEITCLARATEKSSYSRSFSARLAFRHFSLSSFETSIIRQVRSSSDTRSSGLKYGGPQTIAAVVDTSTLFGRCRSFLAEPIFDEASSTAGARPTRYGRPIILTAITAFKTGVQSENFQTTTQKAMPAIMPAIKKALRLTLPIAVAISSWWPRPDASPRLSESNRMSRNRCAKFVASRALHAILALFVECATAVLRDRHEDAIATYWRAVRRHFAASRATIARSRRERFSSLDHASQLPRDFLLESVPRFVAVDVRERPSLWPRRRPMEAGPCLHEPHSIAGRARHE